MRCSSIVCLQILHIFLQILQFYLPILPYIFCKNPFLTPSTAIYGGTQRPRNCKIAGQIDEHLYEAKQTPHRGRRSDLIPFVMARFLRSTLIPYFNCVDIVRFGPKMTLTTLKYIYRVTRNPYLYSVKNFFLYSMWNVTSPFYFYIWVTKFCVLVSNHCNF